MIQLLEAGQRLPQPETCTIDLYALLLECWLLEPDSRPSFHSISLRLEAMLQDPLRFILTTVSAHVGPLGGWTDIGRPSFQSGGDGWVLLDHHSSLRGARCIFVRSSFQSGARCVFVRSSFQSGGG